MSSAAPIPDPKLPTPGLPLVPLSVLEEVLASRVFEKSPSQRRLLSYMWEHREEELNEYKIGTELFGRRSDFEPQLDASVRVQISRLRERLKKFYDAEGSRLSTRLVIPFGTHQIQLIDVELQENPSLFPDVELVSSQPQPSRQNRWILPVLSMIILVLLITNSWMPWMRQSMQQKDARSQQSPLPAFWQQFIGNGKRTAIIFPTPTFFLWTHHLVARDWRVSDISKISTSESLAPLEKRYGKPFVAQYYADAWDITASWRLERFLDPTGTQIALKSTAEFPASALDWDSNLIAIGNPLTFSAPFHSFLDRLSFQLDVQQDDMQKYKVVDRRPAPGAPAMFESVRESPTRSLSPSIVALLPGEARGTHILLVVTAFPPVLVAYLLSEPGLKELEKAQVAHGHCSYFEAVILTETNGETALGSRLVAFKPYDEKL